MTFARIPDFASLLGFPLDGYAIEGIDLSLYSNADLETQEVAVILKRKLH